ncbi:MAG: flagellar export chaperone FliS [Bryobacterales bacterium]|nr:flagellar export chaperone FliS [Bryobacterales bacterium]
MPVQHEEAYLESRIYSATPSELIVILYETALGAVREAQQASEPSELATRTRAISRASSCVMELAGCLNLEVSGELGMRLAVLYEYLLHELLAASARSSHHALPSCERVLAALLEGWTHAMPLMSVALEGTDASGVRPNFDSHRAFAVSNAEDQNPSPRPTLDVEANGEMVEADMVGGRSSWCA